MMSYRVALPGLTFIMNYKIIRALEQLISIYERLIIALKRFLTQSVKFAWAQFCPWAHTAASGD